MPGLPRMHHCVKKALLIGVQYSTTLKEVDPVWELRGAHEDPKTVRQLLIEVYDYKPEDITVLIDDPEKQYVWPTQENILAAMRDLVKGAQPGDHFVFSFSGHGSQVVNKDGTEEDGFDETLIPVDAILNPEYNTFEGYIKDDDVRKIIVDSLPSGSRCVMVFDCCHSGTASDLPNVFSDGLASPCSPLTTFNPRLPWKHSASTDMEQISFQRTSAAGRADDSAQFAWMRGHTRKRSHTMPPESPGPDVTSWSACMDSQITYGGRKGGFFIKAFTDALRSNPHQTHAELLQSVRRELAKYTAAHNMRRTGRGKGAEQHHPQAEPAMSPRAQLGSLRQASYFHTQFTM
ncbi:peptidase C14 [Trametes versicolor FP-101664 SS1]|uniref:peptidase C14 n=1 Tax=Trametes versicolor (strain FP-101664) TaxID=717944 RepID=UPI0004623E1B|nr:peptidase C14 [Trametes versicolor FP-101664 SS1]EIW55200.1 peptidase C14 [Trametes versicolor FP-101664 SS1]